MIYNLLSLVSSFIAFIIEKFSYFGVFVLMMLESAGVPIPSEIIMPFSGFLVSRGVFIFWVLIFVGILGNVVGSLIFYWLGRYIGRSFIMRFGGYLLIHPKDIDLAERWFQRWGSWAIFVSRMLPVVRTYISFPAGVANMNLWKFILFSTIGIIPWVWFLAWLGVFLGEEWTTFEHYFRKFDILILVILISVVVWWVHRHIRHRRNDIEITP